MIDGRAPVSEFVLWSRTPIYLRGIGAEKNPAMIDGRAPTSFASQQGQLEVLHYLCDSDAENNPAMIDGRAPVSVCSGLAL